MNAATYKVRIGDDGRWHYIGGEWMKATATAIKLSESGLCQGQIFVYRDDSRIGMRQYRNGTVDHQSGSMF